MSEDNKVLADVNRQFNFTVSDRQYAYLAKRAKKRGISMTDLLREMVMAGDPNFPAFVDQEPQKSVFILKNNRVAVIERHDENAHLSVYAVRDDDLGKSLRKPLLEKVFDRHGGANLHMALQYLVTLNADEEIS